MKINEGFQDTKRTPIKVIHTNFPIIFNVFRSHTIVIYKQSGHLHWISLVHVQSTNVQFENKMFLWVKSFTKTDLGCRSETFGTNVLYNLFKLLTLFVNEAL